MLIAQGVMYWVLTAKKRAIGNPSWTKDRAMALSERLRVRPASLRAPGRGVYPLSVIRGGVYSQAELKAALLRDRVAAAHYTGFDREQARITPSPAAQAVYVSYRMKDRVYWTRKKVMVAAGEPLITDGVHTARARCGNRISLTPLAPTREREPAVDLDTPEVSSPADAGPPVDLFSLPMLVHDIFPPFLGNWAEPGGAGGSSGSGGNPNLIGIIGSAGGMTLFGPNPGGSSSAGVPGLPGDPTLPPDPVTLPPGDDSGTGGGTPPSAGGGTGPPTGGPPDLPGTPAPPLDPGSPGVPISGGGPSLPPQINPPPSPGDGGGPPGMAPAGPTTSSGTTPPGGSDPGALLPKSVTTIAGFTVEIPEPGTGIYLVIAALLGLLGYGRRTTRNDGSGETRE